MSGKIHRCGFLKRVTAASVMVVSAASVLLSGLRAGTEAVAGDNQVSAKEAKPYGIETRILWTSSRVIGSPEPPLPYRLQRRFPHLKFSEPVYLIPEPGGNRLFLVQYTGKILTFDDNNDATNTAEFHDMKRSTYSVTFHPDYEKNGYVYVFSNGPKENRHNRISRLQTTTHKPRRVIPGSETIVIEWASGGHDGGDMAFGPDGYLYITAGDGTSDSDTNNTGQDITDLPSGVLRIDVDHPDPGKGYGIPGDNPFLHIKDARPELWAFGFRNPWRMSFDDETGNLWLGDVGQDLWETIRLVKRGDNFGWSVKEGAHPFYTERKLGPAPYVPPVVEHPHSEARSITGGFVYHGSRLKELLGTYIYCDYETGIVWGLRYDAGKVIQHRVLADSTYKVASFGRDHAGEIYLIAYSGEILWLERVPGAENPRANFPVKLSETGLFSSVKGHQPAPGVIPYSVNAPVWSDGASTERFLAIPGDGKIEMSNRRGWEFAEGTVLVQTLSLEFEAGNPASRRPIETRLLTLQEGQWDAYSYRWDDAGHDATLVGSSGQDRAFLINDSTAPSGTRRQTWRYPSRAECMVCHSRAAKFVLGLNTLQMNKLHDYGTVSDNQLRTFDHIGLFKKKLDKTPEQYPRLTNPYDLSADLDARARSYLHANCSHCHVAAGGGNAQMELEFTTAPEKTKIFDVTPVQGHFDILAARLVAPGDPYRSVLLFRMSKLGRGRMPQLGSTLVDERAVSLIHHWIDRLPRDSKTQQPGDPVAKLRSRELAALAMLRSSNGTSPAQTVESLFATTSGALMLLRAIDDKTLNGPVRDKIIQKATAHNQVQVRELFERFLPEEQRTKRLGSVIQPSKILALKGDAGRGKRLFFETAGVQCRNCHLIHGAGKQLGPDLSQIGKKYNRRQLLESILEPSSFVDPKFVAYLLETKQGRVYSGLLIEKTAERIRLKDNQLKLIEVPAKEVELLLPQRKSLMPELLLRDMTAQQVADLLEYLGTLK